METRAKLQIYDGKHRARSIVYIGIIIGLALTLALMTAAYIITSGNNGKAEAKLNNYYFESLAELSDNVDEVVLDLSKLSIPMSRGATAATLGELAVHASEGAGALSRIPVPTENTYGAMKLLNQIVDYATGFAGSVSRGYDVGGFVNNAAQFRKAAESLQSRLDEVMRQSMEKGMIDASALSGEWSGSGDGKQESTPDYPEMIYDGPFSDSKLPVSFKSLENMEEITEQEALYRVESILSVKNAKVVGRSTEPDAYEIEADGAYAAVSVKGGMILELTVPDYTGDSKNLTEEDAYTHAAEYAAKLGYGDLSRVWYYESGSVAYINMAPTAGEAILYTDLVKVKISLTDATLLGLEATGYCRNHIDREINAVISERAAAERSGIDYDSVRLCVIPDGETEAVCYEVHGHYDGMEFFVYVDSVTGETVKVLKVVDSGGGRLTA